MAAMSSRKNKPKVTLRDFTPEDAKSVHRWFNTPEAISQLMENRDSFSEEDARGWVERAMKPPGEDKKWAIWVEGREEAVGFIALYGLGRQTAPELGIMIGDDVRGMGVGHEAERLCCKAAFEEFGAHRVYGRIPAFNKAAQGAVRSNGWQLEGTLRGHISRDGELHDMQIWGVLPEEFRAATAGE
jgi:ribosomal-protein-alanine N-acetyltransferase